MQREYFDKDKREYIGNKKIDLFLDEIITVCKKHKISISHEDYHGGFILRPYNKSDKNWLFDASLKDIK